MSSSTTADQAQTPSPSSSSTTASTAAQNRSSQPAKPPSTVSEWQLLAILHRANLLQYYDVFIDKGGDDVNQIMCSEESEFLEIMSIVGMLSKPLHVRRLQRALAQYSNDPTAFNIAAIPHIGAPPVSAYPIGLGATDPVQLFNPVSLSALTSSVSAGLPSVAPSSSSSSSALPSSSSTSTLVPPSLPTPVCSIAATIDAVASVPAITAPSPNNLLMSSSSSPIPVNRTPQFAQLQLLSSIGGTANVLQGDYLQDTMISRSLQYLMENNQHTSTTSPSPLHDDFVALGDFDPNADTGETPVLSDAQIGRLNACSQAAVAKLAPRPPKLVQNKKKISQDIVDLMAMQPMHPRRHDEYRKYSAIYGRFDAKRKADKALTLHEVSINEAAAQICMLAPALLTRRDELFTLSRQVVKDAGYHYTKSTSTGMPRSASSTETATQGTSRKRVQSEAPTEDAASSPRSQTSASPPLNVVDEDPSPSGAGASKRAKTSPHVGAPKSLLDKWAADRIAKTSFDAPGTSTDPK